MRTVGSRDGFILIATLVVLALLASLAGGVALLTRGALEGVWTDDELIRRDALARAGVELAAHQLLTLRLPPARIAGEIRLDGGTARITARDESGFIDLNWSEPALLAGAAATARIRGLSPEAFAGAVVAWRSRNEPRGGGAGQPASASFGAFKRDGFRAVEDLRWLPGLTEEDIAAVSDLLTVHNPTGKVSVLAAPDAVLLAIPGATAKAVSTLRSLPPNRGLDQAARLFDARHAFVGTRTGNAFQVRVETRRDSGTAGSVSAILIRSPSDEAPYLTTQWREGAF